MALLQEWRDYAYAEDMQNSKKGEELWRNYFELEKGIYEQLLTNPEEVVEGTVEGLAEKYEVPLSMMVGFLDGINSSLNKEMDCLSLEIFKSGFSRNFWLFERFLPFQAK